MEPGRVGSATPIIAVLLLLTVLAAACGVPYLLRQRRFDRERAAELAFHTLASAEADFRANERDGNGVNDFWTADVAGLYKYGLISREIAEADVAPLVPLVPQPIPYKGHFFKALVADDSETPPVVYRQATDKKYGAVHHLDHFGFVVYPAGGIAPARYMWIINENCTQFRSMATNPPPSTWPTDNQLKSSWAKVY